MILPQHTDRDGRHLPSTKCFHRPTKNHTSLYTHALFLAHYVHTYYVQHPPPPCFRLQLAHSATARQYAAPSLSTRVCGTPRCRRTWRGMHSLGSVSTNLILRYRPQCQNAPCACSLAPDRPSRYFPLRYRPLALRHHPQSHKDKKGGKGETPSIEHGEGGQLSRFTPHVQIGGRTGRRRSRWWDIAGACHS